MCKLRATDSDDVQDWAELLDDLTGELGSRELAERAVERVKTLARRRTEDARRREVERVTQWRKRKREARAVAVETVLHVTPPTADAVTRNTPSGAPTLLHVTPSAPESVTRNTPEPSRAEVPGTPVPPVLSPETPEPSGTQPSLLVVTSDAEAEAPARARGRRAAAPPPDAAAARGQATAVVEPPARLVAFDAELRQEPTYLPTRRLYDLVERRYPELSADDLETEAYKMREWLHGPKGRGRRCDGRLILEWLKREARDRATRGGWSPPPSAARADTAPLARPPELHAAPPAVDLVPDPAAAELWRRALDKLAAQMSAGNFSLYFRDTWGGRLRDGAPAVGVERAYAVEPLQTRFDGLIRNVLAELTGAPGPVRVVHAHRSPVAAAQRLEA